MIFVSVGTVDPFDRLVKSVDQWLARQPQQVPALVQIGHGRYRPQNCEYVEFLTPNEYRKVFQDSDLVVSHAGMGTIITAVEQSKPTVVMPKRAELGEQRNDHQLATARRFRNLPLIQVADSEEELHQLLDRYVSAGAQPEASAVLDCRPDSSLIDFVRDFVS